MRYIYIRNSQYCKLQFLIVHSNHIFFLWNKTRWVIALMNLDYFEIRHFKRKLNVSSLRGFSLKADHHAESL